MWNMNEVKKIKYSKDYIYYIVFDDGIEGKVDFTEYLKRCPIFEPLVDLTFFRMAKIEGGTISWPNGADISPERLYEKIVSNKSFNRTEHSVTTELIR